MSDLVKFKGGPELAKFLSSLPAKMERNVMRGALRAGATVVQKAARENVREQSEESGDLRRGLKVRTSAKGGVIKATLKATGKHQHIAHLIEYGVAAHGVKKGANRSSGKFQDGKLHPGFAEEPFMRPALDQNAGAALVAAGEYVRKRMDKEGLDAPSIELDEE